MSELLVEPGPGEPKSGCLWCPLFPWSGESDDYGRDADAIRAKEPEGHTVHNRCVGGDPSEWSSADILFVMDAPRVQDDREGLPLNNEDASFLRDAVTTVSKIKRESVAVTSLVRCTTPRGKKPGVTVVRSCSPHLLREIRERRPKVLVPMGPLALEFLTEQTGLLSYNGKVLSFGTENPIPVVPSISPAYVRRNDHEFDKLMSAVKVACRVATGEYVGLPGEGTYQTITDLSGLREMLRDFKEEGTTVSFDTETGDLSPFATEFPQLLCFSFSNREGEGFVVPFDHAGSPWAKGNDRESERGEVIEALREFFLSDIPKLAHNEKFDRNHIRHALGVSPTKVVDSMLIHFCMDEQRGTHGLKTLAHAHTGMGGYDAPLDQYRKTHLDANPRRGGSYANIPADILFAYAGMDADVTLRVYHALSESEEYTEKLRALGHTFLPLLSEALAEVEYAGAQIDTTHLKELEAHYLSEMERVRGAIRSLPVVQQFVRDRAQKGVPDPEFNPGSDAQLREVLFSYYKIRPSEMTDGGLERLQARHKSLTQHARSQREVPPSFVQVVKQAWESGEVQHFSTKADVLQEIARDDNPLAALILEYREFETLYGTFVKGLADKLDDEERIHGTFLIHGTVTGRLASQNPNLQNIPNKGGLIKSAYVSRFGEDGILLQADYSQIELRIAASLFDEETMIRAYREGQDLHRLTAIDIAFPNIRDAEERAVRYDALPKDEQKGWRTRAKRVNFGVLYGGGPPAIQNTLKKDGVFLSLDDCAEMIDNYFKMRPALRAGIDALERDVKRRGYLETFTGRRRRVPEVHSEDKSIVARALRQSVNFPVQSTASDITLMAITLISRLFRKAGFRSRMILTVHDSIVFDCVRDEFERVAALVKATMESVPKYSETVLPGLDWSWLKTPLVADLECGLSWGALRDYSLDDGLETILATLEEGAK
jgi:uracil-DNA glycosylase family 4